MNHQTLLAEILHQDQLPPLTGAQPLADISGWDSLRMVNMVVRLEQLLNRELDEREIENLNTVGDLEALLSRG